MGRSSNNNMMCYIFERYSSSSDNFRRGTDDDYSEAAIARNHERELRQRLRCTHMAMCFNKSWNRAYAKKWG